MYTRQVSTRIIAIGRAMLGYTADVESNELIGLRAQHALLSSATKGELIAAKMLIEEYYSENLYAPIIAESYIRQAKTAVWSIAS